MQPPFGLCFSSTNFIFRTWDLLRLKQLELGSPKMALDLTFNSIIGWDLTFKAGSSHERKLGGLHPEHAFLEIGFRALIGDVH